MVKFEKKYSKQIAALEEGVNFQVERRSLSLLDDEVFYALCEEGMEGFPSNPEAESGEYVYERRMLCVAVLTMSLLRISETEAELIDSLCFGNLLIGVLSMMPQDRVSGPCPACIIKNYSSRNGELGATKRHAPMLALRMWAKAQYNPSEWSSANAAAHAMKEKIMAYGRTINADLQPPNAQRTIAEWFRKSV